METTLQTERELMLWKQAKKRVSFKRQLAAYVIVNVFLWILWYIGDKETTGTFSMNIPWPLWCSLGWGIGLAFKFADAYILNRPEAIEKEFQKLKDRQ